jgi:hypothetical protein
MSPAVAYSPRQDQYLVAYQLCLNGSLKEEISGRRVSWDGSWKSNQFPIQHGPDGQLEPRVAYCKEHDEYLVVYRNDQKSGITEDIAAQRVRAGDGALLCGGTTVTGSNERRRFPHVAYNAVRAEYLVVYIYCDGPGTQARGTPLTYDMGTICPEAFISHRVAL